MDKKLENDTKLENMHFWEDLQRNKRNQATN